MADCYLGEIRMFAGDYAPANWSLCNGSKLSIMSYQALFTLLGTTYGGDGVNDFALPDLRGRLLVSQGQSPSGTNHTLGQLSGTETVPLSLANLPTHTHMLGANAVEANVASAKQAYPGSGTYNAYSNASSGFQLLSAAAVSSVGSGQAHDNVMPYLVVNYIIAIIGMFPQQQ